MKETPPLAAKRYDRNGGMTMSRIRRRVCGVAALLAVGAAWYCGECVAWGSMRLAFGAVMICASIAACLLACWLGGFFDD